MAATSWHTLDQPAFIAASGLGAGGIFLLTVLIRLKQSRDLADASLDGLNAAYPNAGFIGLPLCMLAFGHASLAPAVIGMIMTVCVLFAVAIVLIELDLQTEKKLVATMGKVVRSLATNPLLFAPFAGWLCSGAGLTIAGGADTFLKLLGAAASPCALAALGLFLGEKPEGGAAKNTSMLVLAKLVAQPLLTWWLAFHVFALPELWAKTAVILSALPTGTGPFMLAEFYKREAAVTSSIILFSTVISLVTVTVCLAALT